LNTKTGSRLWTTGLLQGCSLDPAVRAESAGLDNLTSSGSSHWRMLEQVIDQVPLPARPGTRRISIPAVERLSLRRAHYSGGAATGCDYWKQAPEQPGSTTRYWCSRPCVLTGQAIITALTACWAT